MSKFQNQSADSDHSLLGAIRQKEAAITREMAAARDATARELKLAEIQAQQIIAQAAEDGRLEGESARGAAHVKIEQEAAAIITQAQNQAAAMRQLKPDILETALANALEILAPTHDG